MRWYERIHRIASWARHSPLLGRQRWLWRLIEPPWRRLFLRLTREAGYISRINQDTFRLVYTVGGRWDTRHYETNFYRAFTEQIKPSMTVFDIGAYVGVYALGAAQRVGARGQVYAFEPAPETAAILRRHLVYNHFTERIQVVEAVVADQDGVLPFYTYHTSMAASLGRANMDRLNPERLETAPQEIQAEAITLDTFCEARGITPDVMKIDIEGAELLALRGARRLLEQKAVVILCEVHPQQMKHVGGSLPELDAYLTSLGYGMQALDTPGPMGIFHSLIIHAGRDA